MRLLLILEKQEVRELLSFQLSTRFPVSVKEVATVEEGTEFLKKEEASRIIAPIDIVITPFSGKENPLTQYLKSKTNPVPAIFLHDGNQPESKELSGIVNLGFVEMQHLVEGVAKLLEDFLAKAGPATDAADFCPIRTNLLIRATPLQSDIYIRLSKDKYVKIFQSGTVFDHADLEKYYQTKKVEYMYLRRSETAEFTAKFTKELDTLLAKADLNAEEALLTAEMAQEVIQELVHNSGFSPEVQALAKKNVQLALKAIGKSPTLSSLLAKVQKDGNYIAQHSILLANVSCCLAKEMEWGSDSTFTKLALAAFMHDISMHEPELAKINTLTELQEQKDKFPEELVKSYHLHPMRSAELVKSFQEIPADVDIIVSHHHERPDGSGFPRGLSHNYIAPLAAVFIVAHDMAQEIIKKRENFRLRDFLEDTRGHYFQGNFKKVIAALEKMKLE